MNPDQIKQLIESRMPGATARVTGDGSHFEAIVISDAFEGLSMLKEHQMVYGAIGAEIASGAIHALSIKAYTPAEWEALAS
ncbi:MAG: BolA family transcriptional regulator [Chromatiales bacterium]|jgi:acid stress-induced BolA-like protein IbaG/YrbA|nr:BolA family transcriptional regulator [Chromatiales bacterium]MDX9766008.1 BolA family protein [Ectothiorhodospiraceae bacterium]